MTNAGNSDASRPEGSDVVLVYATFPNAAAALKCGRSLVEARLAGCINVLPTMTSVYVWEGKTETADESALIAKTRAELAGRVSDAIKAEHVYEIPAILVIAVSGGNAGYLDWLRANTDMAEGTG